MAVRSQEIRSTVTRQGAAQKRPTIAVPSIQLNNVVYVATLLLALLAIYAVLGHVVSWGSARIDDLRYGTTRTFQMQGVVGHNDSESSPTHFIAMNLNRQVVVIEIPGGDASQVRTITGPYLFGANEDKTPVVLRLEDLNRDGAKDLIVNVKNEELVYLNKNAEFQPITTEERAQILANR